MSNMIRYDDLIITVAYFSIPLQIVVALFQYPRLRMMPWSIVVLTVLFALFIFLCGTGHLFRCLGMNHGAGFDALNIATAAVSLTTALYLLPLMPYLFASLDKTLEAEKESKRKVLTFMSFLCHEIRNPLFAITSNITFLSDDRSLSEEQRDSLDGIEQSANLMLRLVNDVLHISKLESGKLRLEQEPFGLIKTLEGGASSIEKDIYQTHGSAVSFEMDMSSRVPRHAIGDSVRVLQIVFNLLSNSAKFTEQGFIKFSVDVVPICTALQQDWVQEGPTKDLMRKKCSDEIDVSGETESCSAGLSKRDEIALSLLQHAEEGRIGEEECRFSTVVLKLQIEDSGVGISTERQKHIFQPYSQAKLSDYRRHGGTGLGLSIVTRLVEIMGGTIHMESELHQGSTFTVYVPLKVDRFLTPVGCVGGRLDSDIAVNNGGEESAGSEGRSMKENSVKVALSGLYRNNSQQEVGSCKKSGPVFPPLCNSSETAPTTPTTTAPATPSLVTRPRKRPGEQVPSQHHQRTQFNFAHNEKVILVVDDNAINRKLLGRMLKHFNLQCFYAENGQEAVDFVEKSRNFTQDSTAPNIGLILMDWSMPVMDGYDATKAIRAMKLDVPIVALTACALEEGLQALTKAGSDEIKTKPILRDDLHRVCVRYLVEWTPASVVGSLSNYQA
jgi:signal transduction histidine kinase/CheY-like chemotaxis protein